MFVFFRYELIDVLCSFIACDAVCNHDYSDLLQDIEKNNYCIAHFDDFEFFHGKSFFLLFDSFELLEEMAQGFTDRKDN